MVYVCTDVCVCVCVCVCACVCVCVCVCVCECVCACKYQVVVGNLGLLVAGSRVLSLTAEAFALGGRVVLLRVGVAVLEAVDEELKALRHARVVAVHPRQRRRHDRVVHDKGRVPAGGLNKRRHQLVEHAGGRRRRRAHEPVYCQLLLQQRCRLGGTEARMS